MRSSPGSQSCAGLDLGHEAVAGLAFRSAIREPVTRGLGKHDSCRAIG